MPDEILRSGGQQWELHRHAYCDQCELQARLQDRASARMWLRRFKADKDCMDELRRLLARESDVSLRLDRASDDDVLDQAARMFEIGRWHVHGSHIGHAGGTQSPGAPGEVEEDEQQSAATPPRLSDSKKLTWVGIKLVDDNGKPVSGVAYEIKFPDGSLWPGKLGDDGTARHDQIDPGQCQVRFPEMDASEWEPA